MGKRKERKSERKKDNARSEGVDEPKESATSAGVGAGRDSFAARTVGAAAWFRDEEGGKEKRADDGKEMKHRRDELRCRWRGRGVDRVGTVACAASRESWKRCERAEEERKGGRRRRRGKKTLLSSPVEDRFVEVDERRSMMPYSFILTFSKPR
jgi:hypothetical protein